MEKTNFTLKELDQIGADAYKTFDQACQDIEEIIRTELGIDLDDYMSDDDDQAELIYHLNDYLFPWSDYDDKINALKWLKENKYITDYENA